MRQYCAKLYIVTYPYFLPLTGSLMEFYTFFYNCSRTISEGFGANLEVKKYLNKFHPSVAIWQNNLLYLLSVN